jgi:ribosomal silencing factor RsfS
MVIATARSARHAAMAAAALVHAAKEEEKRRLLVGEGEEEKEDEGEGREEAAAAALATETETEAKPTLMTTAAAVEGEPGASDWLLVDLGTVVAHVFSSAEAREHYALERLWGAAGGFGEETGEEEEEEEEKDGTH